jgi:hypothetical protein
VSVLIQRAQSCAPDTTLAWQYAINLGYLSAGRHDITVSIRAGGAGDSLGVHDYPVSFNVADDGPPPPPPGAPGDSLTASRPNPFSSVTRFAVVLPSSGHVAIGIYDLQGRRVRSLFDGPLASGSWEFAWDGRREDGARATPGIYFYRTAQSGRVLARRVVLLKP